jgi:type II secretory pathway component PulF
MNENVIFLIMLGIILCLVYLLYILPSMMTDYKVNGCYIQPTNVLMKCVDNTTKWWFE